LSAFGDFLAHFLYCNPLKTQDVSLAQGLHLYRIVLQETMVIVYALLAAVLVLVAVAFTSSIDFSNTRRR
jgi:hypothetical protein